MVSVILAIFAAFAVSRFRFRGRGVFTTTVLSTQMFPGILFLLPLFIIFVNIDSATGIQLLYRPVLGLILTYLTFSLPFSVWMLVGYFDSIPRSSTRPPWSTAAGRSARCSGSCCRPPRPGVVAVAIYAFMTAWGEVLFASA